MKTKYLFAAMAALTVLAVGCKKDDAPSKGNDGDKGQVKREWRVKTMGDYTYNYGADGKVASVVSEGDNRVFTYKDNVLTITDNDVVEYTMTLNADGFATKVENTEHTWEITYDENGYLVSAKKDGVQCTSQSIEDGNILYWTRYDKDHDFWRMKDATYFNGQANLGCIQTHYAEDLGFKRWAWEARLFGNTSVNLLESCIWHNYGDEMASKTAVYEYEKDANGLVTKEVKYYGVWNGTDTSGMDLDNEVVFTWEKIQ